MSAVIVWPCCKIIDLFELHWSCWIINVPLENLGHFQALCIGRTILNFSTRSLHIKEIKHNLNANDSILPHAHFTNRSYLPVSQNVPVTCVNVCYKIAECCLRDDFKIFNVNHSSQLIRNASFGGRYALQALLGKTLHLHWLWLSSHRRHSLPFCPMAFQIWI